MMFASRRVLLFLCGSSFCSLFVSLFLVRTTVRNNLHFTVRTHDLRNSQETIGHISLSQGMRMMPTFKNDTPTTLKEIMAREQERRLSLLRDGCKHFNKSHRNPVDYSHMLVNDAHGILFNFIPKVSCSTWKRIFRKLYVHNKTGHFKLGAYSAEEKSTRIANYRKVLFVRDPMSRILSTYMSKFCALATGNDSRLQRSWENWYGRDIVKRYRGIKVKTLKGGEHLNITMTEFMNYIVDVGSGIKMTPINDHWLPQNVVSHPCQIGYDFIGHFEDLSVEGPYVLKWLKVDHLVQFPKYHVSKAVENLVKYYKEVPLGVVHKVTGYYEKDYKLFGYSADNIASQLTKGLFGKYDQERISQH
ncbi:carbohydrate sulfotransferase 14-like [Acanthaster planci]|uniref:Carbohydrate sulfotransferase n=1 Tax=Acanthaster planci TaxID=133434 RepID=A0A8B7ZUE8_ACAPL|nr:carbohydrate sulfotransferase 14-like [Acanthaster planci]